MKLIYVAGPYRSANGPWGIYENIDRARRIARQLWFMGFAVICPHSNTGYMDGAQNTSNEFGVACGISDNVFLRGDIEQLRRSDAIVLIPGWRRSSGSLGEKAAAEQFGIPVFEWPRDKQKIQ